MHYVDGFVVPVKKAKLQSYRRLARKRPPSARSTGRSSTSSASLTT